MKLGKTKQAEAEAETRLAYAHNASLPLYPSIPTPTLLNHNTNHTSPYYFA
jgi:hypothetical protein